MDKLKFHSNQLVGVTDMDGIETILESYSELVNKEIISIDGFVYDDGMEATANDPADMNVNVGEGSAWKNYKRIVIPTGETAEVTIDPAHATLDRIDLISIQYDTLDNDPQVTKFKNPETKVKYNDTVNRQTIDYFEIAYTAGTPAETPEAPAIPTGHIGLYTVAVGAAVTSITDSDLTRIAPEKPDILVGSHRTAVPIDHPDESIFDQHISATADILTNKINGLGYYASLKELLEFAFDTLPLPVDVEYAYDVTSGNLSTATCAALGAEKTFSYNAETGYLETTTTENDDWIYTKTYTYDESGRLTGRTATLEAK